MSWKTTAAGLLVIVVVLYVTIDKILRAQVVDLGRATLIVTAVMCGITALYALLTFGILLENRAMAKTATESTQVMERGVRFSYAPNLMFQTIITKDPKFTGKKEITPFNSEDYQAALREYSEGQDQTEFVFAIVKNVGRGAATQLEINCEYTVRDSSNANRNLSVRRKSSIQLLEPEKSVAISIYVSKVPTGDDRVQIVSASLSMSDFYRDALQEKLQHITINPEAHHTEPESGCVVKIA
jgi:hypothetical protein